MKVLVLGAGGQLGSEMVRILPQAVGLKHGDLSVTDVAGIERTFGQVRPELGFNCAAYNAVDGAEGDPETARLVNSVGAGMIAAACRRHEARLVHFSTNFVFDGSQSRPYVETDPTGPLGAYGRSKLDGERAVADAVAGALVIRTAAVFGDRGSAVKGGSFPERILERAKKGERLRVVSDQHVNPTYARHLAGAAVALAAGGMAGVIHVVAAGCCAWDELARATLSECAVDVAVDSVTSGELAALAPRPLNGCLASLRTAPLPPWRDGLAEWAANRAAVGPSNP